MADIREANFEIKLVQDKGLVYYDEIIEYMILAKGNFRREDIDDLKISVIGTISDSQKMNFLSKSTGSLAVEKYNKIGVEITNPDDQILFSQDCDLSKCTLQDGLLSVTMSSKIDIGRKRALSTSQSTLTITAYISQLLSHESKQADVDPVAFDGVNPFQALEFNSLFKDQYPVVIIPNASKQPPAPTLQPFKKTALLNIGISPLVSATLNINSLSGSTSFLGISLESRYNGPVTIEEIVVDMPGALITNEFEQLPIVLLPNENFQALYSVRLFDSLPFSGIPGSNKSTDRQSLSFTVKSRFTSAISSDFCARLAKNPDGGLQTGNMVANHGRLFESAQTKLDRSVFVGLEFSLNILPPIEKHKVFSVQMLISNTGTRPRSISVQVAEPAPSERVAPIVRPEPDIFMDPQGIPYFYAEMIELYHSESEAPATMICLESRTDLKPIQPSSCRLLMLHFIVIQGNVHPIPNIHVLDRDSNKEYLLRDTLKVYIHE